MNNIDNLIENLNKEQKEAVLSTEGPNLIVAGAGSGKTRVLTTRLIHIINEKKAWPNQILCVTFTNKAAREMRYRLGNYIPINRNAWLGTFHGLANKFLQINYQAAGLKADFNILDATEQIRTIKQIITDLKLDDKKWQPRQAAWFINNHKEAGRRDTNR